MVAILDSRVLALAVGRHSTSAKMAVVALSGLGHSASFLISEALAEVALRDPAVPAMLITIRLPEEEVAEQLQSRPQPASMFPVTSKRMDRRTVHPAES